MKKIILSFVIFVSVSTFAKTITCKQGDRDGKVILETSTQSKNVKMTVMDYGEVIYTSNGKEKSNDLAHDGAVVYESTTKAEGNPIHGPLPAWSLSLTFNFSNKGIGHLEVLSDKLREKLSMFETNERLYCE